jgi:ATP-dependent Lon protease
VIITGLARWPRWRAGHHPSSGAQAALTLIKAHADTLGFDFVPLGKSDVHYSRAGGRRAEGRAERWRHVHGAGIAADGPHRSQRHRHDRGNLAARLGPADRRGEGKMLAAVRAGIATVLLPARNRKDLEDVPEAARKQIDIVWL